MASARRIPEITPDTRSRLAYCVSIGASLESAAAFCEITHETLLDWLSLAEDFNDNPTERTRPFWILANMIRKARADFEIETLASLAKLKAKKFQAVKFVLERRFNEQWSRRPAINAEAFLIRLKSKLPAPIFAQVTAALSEGPAARYYPDPVEFCKETLGTALWTRQAEAARALTQNRRVAVKSGHKVGKSTLAAAIALWWTSDPISRPFARVVITAPTDRQVKGIVWREIRRLYHRAQVRGQPLGGTGHLDPGTGIQWPDGREIVGFATDQAERIAGYSGEHILFIADEASGVASEIFEAIEGNRAGGGSLLMLGNPTRPSGEFFNAFNAAATWGARFTISSRDTPNATGKGQPIPGLATADYAKEKRAEWGEDDPRYQIRVEGEFPDNASNTIIPRKLIRAARARYEATEAEGALVFGLDPARFGDDDPILQPRRGKKASQPIKLPNGDGATVANFARQKIREIREENDYQDTIRVNVDGIGVGASVFDHLNAIAEEDDLEVINVNVALPSKKEDDFVNLRDELYFEAQRWLKNGGALPDCDKLADELAAHEYGFDSKGRCKVEPKEALKKRIGRSPDRADALCLSLYEKGAARYTSLRKGKR